MSRYLPGESCSVARAVSPAAKGLISPIMLTRSSSTLPSTTDSSCGGRSLLMTTSWGGLVPPFLAMPRTSPASISLRPSVSSMLHSLSDTFTSTAPSPPQANTSSAVATTRANARLRFTLPILLLSKAKPWCRLRSKRQGVDRGQTEAWRPHRPAGHRAGRVAQALASPGCRRHGPSDGLGPLLRVAAARRQRPRLRVGRPPFGARAGDAALPDRLLRLRHGLSQPGDAGEVADDHRPLEPRPPRRRPPRRLARARAPGLRLRVPACEGPPGPPLRGRAHRPGDADARAQQLRGQTLPHEGRGEHPPAGADARAHRHRRRRREADDGDRGAAGGRVERRLHVAGDVPP